MDKLKVVANQIIPNILLNLSRIRQLKLMSFIYQWRIHNIPEIEAANPPRGTSTYDFAKFSQKTA